MHRTTLVPLVLLAPLFALAPSPVPPASDPVRADAYTLAARSPEGVYQLPFASKGNRVELAVANAGAASASAVRVRISEAPAWLAISPEEVMLNALGASREALATFTFAVDEAAPVQEAHALVLEVTTAGGVRYAKEIRVQAEAPTEVKLHANYPNPFNPSTTIGYTLTREARVSLRVYNMLGQEVAVLAEGRQPAGYHRVRWEAGSAASGLYLYRLVAEMDDGRRTVRQNKMLLIK